jgi:hypothetical protein
MTAQVNQLDSQGRPHGVWEKYLKPGSPWWRGRYLHGQKHGLWEWYWADGTPSYKLYHLNIK